MGSVNPQFLLKLNTKKANSRKLKVQFWHDYKILKIVEPLASFFRCFFILEKLKTNNLCIIFIFNDYLLAFYLVL